jgi:hypothetical protein
MGWRHANTLVSPRGMRPGDKWRPTHYGVYHIFVEGLSVGLYVVVPPGEIPLERGLAADRRGGEYHHVGVDDVSPVNPGADYILDIGPELRHRSAKPLVRKSTQKPLHGKRIYRSISQQKDRSCDLLDIFVE